MNWQQSPDTLLRVILMVIAAVILTVTALREWREMGPIKIAGVLAAISIALLCAVLASTYGTGQR